jgi:hypothetical protein
MRTFGCHVALIEDEVDHLQDRAEALPPLFTVRGLEGNGDISQGPFGAHDALGNGCFRYQECARDVAGRQSAQYAQRKRGALLGREHRMAGGEDQSQQVVVDVLVECGVTGGRLALEFGQVDRKLAVFALDQRRATQSVEGAVLGDLGQPGGRIARNAVARPAFECQHKGVLISFAGIAGSIEYVRSGKLRALAVTTTTRSEALPDVPTVSEFVPGFEGGDWLGVGAPRETPTEFIDGLNKEITAGVADPKIKAGFADLGGIPLALTPVEFGKFLAAETDKWAKVIRAANIKAE